MRRDLLRVLVLGISGALSGCGNATTGAMDMPLTATSDMTAPSDLAMSDLSRMSDFAVANPDIATAPDLVMDASVPADLRVAEDFAVAPDLLFMDLVTTDMAVAVDLAKPDLAMPDLSTLPDLAHSPDLSTPDLTVPPPDLIGSDLSAAKTVTVIVAPNGDLEFLAQNQTIKVGDSIQWVWASSGHNVVSGEVINGKATPDNRFCSPVDAANCTGTPTSNSGFAYTHQFLAPGTFPYFCAPHAAFGMTGTIIVQ